MLAVIDTETTGPEPGADFIVELGSLKNDHDKRSGSFNRLFKPPIPIPYEAMAIHHITNEDVADKGPCADAHSDVVDYMSDVTKIIAHNLKFDGTLLRREFPGVFERFAEDEEGCICTLRVARHLWPELPSHRLHVLMYRFNIADGKSGKAHRADFDCMVTWGLMRYEAEYVIKNREGVSDYPEALRELTRLTRKPILYHHLAFGKHKGVPLAKIDKGYLSWLSRQEWVKEDPDLIYTARYYLGHERKKK